MQSEQSFALSPSDFRGNDNNARIHRKGFGTHDKSRSRQDKGLNSMSVTRNERERETTFQSDPHNSCYTYDNQGEDGHDYETPSIRLKSEDTGFGSFTANDSDREDYYHFGDVSIEEIHSRNSSLQSQRKGTPPTPAEHRDPLIEDSNSSRPSSQHHGCGKRIEKEKVDERKKRWHIGVIEVYALTIFFFCICTYIACALVIKGCLDNKQTSSNTYNTMIRLPCDDLTNFYSVASLYKYTDDIINLRFQEAGIRRVKDENNNIMCEVPLSAIIERMSRKEINSVEGRVDLDVIGTGPSREFSHFNMTIRRDDKLRDIDQDPHSLIVKEEGNYFVYFGIQLEYKDDKICRKLRYKTHITHLLIQERSVHKPRALLASEHTCCLTCETESNTGFSAGLFHFKGRDRLFIQVSSPGLVKKSGEHFLGVFRLTSNE